MNSMRFLFTLPADEPSVSRIANAAIKLSAIANRLAQENRTLVCHASGRAENVSEHSHMLSIVAPGIAEEFYPKLNADLVGRFSTIHDAVEAYVGDTPTHKLNPQGYAKKDVLERAGFLKLKSDYAALPKFVMLVEMYEEQKVAEARFVRMVDKWTTLLLHFTEDGSTLRKHFSKSDLEKNLDQHSVMYKKDYSDFADVIAVREELMRLAFEKWY